MSGVLFKIDFEKAYEKVNWAFLYQMMQAKGLGDVFCDWVMKVVFGFGANNKFFIFMQT
jgi:hypothetical protein